MEPLCLVVKYINHKSIANLSLTCKSLANRTSSIRHKLLIKYANSYHTVLDTLITKCERNISIYPKNIYGVTLKNSIDLICTICKLFTTRDISYQINAYITNTFLIDKSVSICECIKCIWCLRFNKLDYPNLIIHESRQCYCHNCENCNKKINANGNIPNECECVKCGKCNKFPPYELINNLIDESYICKCKRCIDCGKRTAINENGINISTSDDWYGDGCMCQLCDDCDQILFTCMCGKCEECSELIDDCDCGRCSACNELVGNCYDPQCECDRCDECEELIDDCDCEFCQICKKLCDECECDQCDYCEELIDNCECERCEICKELDFECECKKCDYCNKLIDNCECKKCEKCKKLVCDCSFDESHPIKKIKIED